MRWQGIENSIKEMEKNTRVVKCPNCGIDERLVFFVEPGYDVALNEYLRTEFSRLSNLYRRNDKELIFLPAIRGIIGDEAIEYLLGSACQCETDCKEALRGVLPDEVLQAVVAPSMVWYSEQAEGFFVEPLPVDDDTHRAIDDYFRKKDRRRCGFFGIIHRFSDGDSSSFSSFSNHEKGSSTILHTVSCSECSDSWDDGSDSWEVQPSKLRVPLPLQSEDFDDYEQRSIDDYNRRLISKMESLFDELHSHGISDEFIINLLKSKQKLSRLLVTENHALILPDYGNKEVHLSTVEKALFFLFLRYPEGIDYKHLVDHEQELYNIYIQLSSKYSDEKKRMKIRNLCDSTRNDINISVSRIKRAFCAQMADSLAQNYYIRGAQGEKHLITLDRNMVEWE